MKSTSMYDDPRGFVCKLGDFGLSRVLEHNSTHVSTNTYGNLVCPLSSPTGTLYARIYEVCTCLPWMHAHQVCTYMAPCASLNHAGSGCSGSPVQGQCRTALQSC